MADKKNDKSREKAGLNKLTENIKHFFGFGFKKQVFKSNKYKGSKYKKDFKKINNTETRFIVKTKRKNKTNKLINKKNNNDFNNSTHRKRKRENKFNSSKKSNLRDSFLDKNSGSTRLNKRKSDNFIKKSKTLTDVDYEKNKNTTERIMLVRDSIEAKNSQGPKPGSLMKNEKYTQIAVLEDKKLAEHFITTTTSASQVGNIYLGIVQNVLPSMEAAFIDIGEGRNGVLYAGELEWDKNVSSAEDKKIENILKSGDLVVVQVTKDPIGSKGARLTMQIAIPGRHLVYLPDSDVTGISRKIPESERNRLKNILKDIQPKNVGIIIRTASEGVSKEDLKNDLERSQEKWVKLSEQIVKEKEKASGVPVSLYQEPPLLIKVIRDLFNEDFKELQIAGNDSWKKIQKYLTDIAPELLDRVKKYKKVDNAGLGIFDSYKVEEALMKGLSKKVWLPSGGTLVIDRTEAMTIIDVNTGKFIGTGGNLEETVTRNNLEAVDEIVHQIRLRDIGGIIIVDFIDMQNESNRDQVLARLIKKLGADRTRHQVSEVTSLGLIQITRKKLGTGLVEAFSVPCSTCSGRGILIKGERISEDSSTIEAAEGERRKENHKSNLQNDKDIDPAAHPMIAAMEKDETSSTQAAERVNKTRRKRTRVDNSSDNTQVQINQNSESVQSEFKNSDLDKATEMKLQENKSSKLKFTSADSAEKVKNNSGKTSRKVSISAGYNKNLVDLPKNLENLRQEATKVSYQITDAKISEKTIFVEKIIEEKPRRKATWNGNKA